MIFDIDAQVIVNGQDISQFVISYSRNHNICNVIQTGDIVCSPNLKTFLDENELAINPYDEVSIYELGIKVLTGFVSAISRSRKPVFTIVISFADTYKLARDYFIDIPDLTTYIQPLPTAISTLLAMAGLNMDLVSSSLSDIIIPPGENLSFVTVSAAVEQLAAYGNAIIYAGGNGDIKLQKGAINSNVRFDTGLYTISNGTVTLQGTVSSAIWDETDENSRDIIKVWGQLPPWEHLSPGQSPFITAERTVDLGLPVHKTSLYSSSIIQTQAEADRLADEMILEIGKIDNIYQIECQGNPRVYVGKKAFLNINLETAQVTGNAKITSVKTSVSERGYIMNVSLNEFCPKFAGWSIAPTVIYAGLNGNGIYISPNKGVNWQSYNTGLPSGIKIAERIGADPNGNAISIVNDALYYETNDIWSTNTLPTPEFGGSYGSLVSVGCLGGYNSFAVLTAGGNGSFVYFSEVDENAIIGLSGWTSTKMYYEDFTVPSGSTITYNLTARDMYTKTGVAFVLAHINTSGYTYYSNPGSQEYEPGNIALTIEAALIDTSQHPSPPDPNQTTTEISGNTLYIQLSQNTDIRSAIKITTTGSEYPDGYGCRTRIRGKLFVGRAFPDDPVDDTDNFSLVYRNSNTTAGFYASGITASPSLINWRVNERTYNSLLLEDPVLGGMYDFDLYSPQWWSGTQWEDYVDDWHATAYIDLSFLNATTHLPPEPLNRWNVNIQIDRFDIEYYDGGITSIIYSGGNNLYGLFSVYPASTCYLETLVSGYIGSANDRLYVSDDYQFYIYNNTGILYTYSGEDNFHSIFPTGGYGRVSAITQSNRQDIVDISSGYSTVIGAITGTETDGKYQSPPEISAGWLNTASIPAGLVSKDAIWSFDSTQGVLMGGTNASPSGIRICRFDPSTPDFSTVLASDDGIPDEINSDVLDLEYGL